MNCRLCLLIVRRSLLTSAVPGKAWDRGVGKTWAEIAHDVAGRRTTADHFNQIGAKPSSCLVDRDYVVVSRQTRLAMSLLGSLQLATPLPQRRVNMAIGSVQSRATTKPLMALLAMATLFAAAGSAQALCA